MKERKHSVLDELAAQATITIEQAAKVLGLGRTASARNSGGYGGFERGTWTPFAELGPSAQVSTKAGQVQLQPRKGRT